MKIQMKINKSFCWLEESGFSPKGILMYVPPLKVVLNWKQELLHLPNILFFYFVFMFWCKNYIYSALVKEALDLDCDTSLTSGVSP